MADNLDRKLRLPRMPSFTCRNNATWDKRLYFPSEGRRAEDFFALKNPTASAVFEPANLGIKGQHATSRPPKPLTRSNKATRFDIFDYHQTVIWIWYQDFNTLICNYYVILHSLVLGTSSTQMTKTSLSSETSVTLYNQHEIISPKNSVLQY